MTTQHLSGPSNREQISDRDRKICKGNEARVTEDPLLKEREVKETSLLGCLTNVPFESKDPKACSVGRHVGRQVFQYFSTA